MENPRCSYEASGNGMILDTRERQLHDEPLSCGTQPAYIRLINRRFAAWFALSALFKQVFNLILKKQNNRVVDRSIHIRSIQK